MSNKVQRLGHHHVTAYYPGQFSNTTKDSPYGTSIDYHDQRNKYPITSTINHANPAQASPQAYQSDKQPSPC